MKDSKECLIDISGWEIEILVSFEYKIYEGYPQTRWEPEEPAEIEFTIDEDKTITQIIKEVVETARVEKQGIAFNISQVLDDIQEYLDEDDSLQADLFDDAYQERLEYEYEKAEYKRDEREDR